MSKNFLFRFLVAAGLLGAAVLWLLAALKVLDPFNWLWTVVVLAGAWGVAFLFRGMFSKGNTVLKKWNIFAGAGLAVIAIIALILALAVVNLTAQLVIAIIATAFAAAILLGVVFTGGKKWDQGDNQKVGYKNYYQRKEEEEKAAKKAEQDDE